MAWEKNNRGNPRFVIKQRIKGKVMSKVFRTEEAARAYRQDINEKKDVVKRMLEHELEVERKMDLLEKLVNQMIEHDLVCRGMIRRQGVWQFVDRLNKPLTHEEKLHIRRIKANAVPCYMSPNWPMDGSRLMTLAEFEASQREAKEVGFAA
jgi:hypothetical protein